MIVGHYMITTIEERARKLGRPFDEHYMEYSVRLDYNEDKMESYVELFDDNDLVCAAKIPWTSGWSDGPPDVSDDDLIAVLDFWGGSPSLKENGAKQYYFLNLKEILKIETFIHSIPQARWANTPTWWVKP